MWYVCFIIDLNIMYEVSESMKLVKYSDSNYVLNKLNHKLILIYIYILNEELIFWMSWKQKFVITLIIETKYMILSICIKKDLWINQVFKNMNLTKYLSINHNHVDILEKITYQSVSLTQLKKNNQASFMLIKNVHIYERLKYIDITYHHIQNLHKKN